MPKRVSLKGKGADLFFGDDPAGNPPVSADEVNVLRPDQSDPDRNDPVTPAPTPPADAEASRGEPSPASSASRRRSSPRQRAGQSPKASNGVKNADSTLASTLASYQHDEIELIRKAVKPPGREVSFVRLTPQEKEQLVDIVYAAKRQGQKTSENEINRIAINILLADYRAKGEGSVLARVLAALHD